MEIEARELRIGNWVNPLFGKVKGKVTRIDNDVIFITTSKGTSISWSIKELLPIPLTPEILEGCGFNTGRCQGVVFEIAEPNSFGLGLEDNGDWTCNNMETDIPIKYLHQLQNLYFALTGEELTIKL